MRNLVVGAGVAAVVIAVAAVYLNYGPWISFREKRAFISDKLKDPESTRFRGEHLSQAGWLCGELNSKNGSGGYTGFKKFFVRTSGEAYLEGEGSLNQPSAADVIELLREQNEVTKSYIALRESAPNVEIPSESYRNEQAKRQLFEKKIAVACG